MESERENILLLLAIIIAPLLYGDLKLIWVKVKKRQLKNKTNSLEFLLLLSTCLYVYYKTVKETEKAKYERFVEISDQRLLI